jgi:hypothetical protein
MDLSVEVLHPLEILFFSAVKICDIYGFFFLVLASPG